MFGWFKRKYPTLNVGDVLKFNWTNDSPWDEPRHIYINALKDDWIEYSHSPKSPNKPYIPNRRPVDSFWYVFGDLIK